MNNPIIPNTPAIAISPHSESVGILGRQFSSNANPPRLAPPVADTPPTNENIPVSGFIVTRNPPSSSTINRAVPPNKVPSHAN